ncbi:MAG: ECF transporter S component [Butyrivibrio sp.]|nr:ECF transporter S component [Acetatifactor muris]MCM1560790.1 ECF transporter S component [Butyrivibrio sp.]
MRNEKVKKLTLSAMFMAVGMILPFFTGQIPQIGNMLLPMHIPVLLCGLICGWQYGLAVGFILPLFRHVVFGMPVLIPAGAAMAVELAVYGSVVGFLYSHSKWQCVRALYRCLITAMLAGRVAWAAMRLGLTLVTGEPFTFQMFLAGGFTNAIPGIIIQLVLIPLVMVALNKTGLVPFHKKGRKPAAVEAYSLLK